MPIIPWASRTNNASSAQTDKKPSIPRSKVIYPVPGLSSGPFSGAFSIRLRQIPASRRVMARVISSSRAESSSRGNM